MQTTPPEDAKQTAPPKLSKAEKRAQHTQLQKQLWDTAENPSRNLWLEAQGAVPLKQEPKVPMTVLSRKPMLAKRDPGSGATMDDGEDSEEEARRKKEADYEERKRRAAIEREEKVKKYAEARERIMGTSTSGSPAAGSRESSQGRDHRRPKGKGSRPASGGQSPARSVPVQNAGGGGQLAFDPEDMGRRLVTRRETPSTPKEGEPMRQPKGPDARAGFGFGR